MDDLPTKVATPTIVKSESIWIGSLRTILPIEALTNKRGMILFLTKAKVATSTELGDFNIANTAQIFDTLDGASIIDIKRTRIRGELLIMFTPPRFVATGGDMLCDTITINNEKKWNNIKFLRFRKI
ncbi:unnamed protein product [Lupinus luteus]|uniref:Uncharacterized protein n=1 Tax=Lupinus luteus TaxID=3873 RepID=A0AAV1WPW8_LUPLU